MEAHSGKYDNDGFYLLPGGDFFDKYGYYFDTNGNDASGGYYHPKTGVYVAARSETARVGAADGHSKDKQYPQRNAEKDRGDKAHGKGQWVDDDSVDLSKMMEEKC